MFRSPRFDHWRDVLILCLVLVGLQQLAGAGVIKAKAWLAPILIASAWEQTLDRAGTPVKPWPWADTWPVGRLQVAAEDVDLFVLSGDSGNALAFGPGHARASAPLGSPGLAVIGGHRDTHFGFLQRLQPATRLQLQLPSGELRDYRLEQGQVVDARQHRLSQTGEDEGLLLVTCYPFESLQVNGPLRYVVRARPEADNPIEF